MKKILSILTLVCSCLSCAATFGYDDFYDNDIPKPTLRDMHYYYAQRGAAPNTQMQVKGHFVIIGGSNTYAPSVSKLKNKRHYYRVVANNYGAY